MSTFVKRTVVVGLVATLTSPLALSTPANAAKNCSKREDLITTTKGRNVWIPSSLVTSWTADPGPLTVSWGRGDDYATSKGSADTVSGTAGINVKVFEASGSYNREWNRNTTKTHTRTEDYEREFVIPKKGKWRVRWYQLGREFQATKTRYYGNCPSKKTTRTVRVPLASTKGNRLIRLEKYSKRNQFRY